MKLIKQNKYITPVKKNKNLQHSAVPIGQPQTKGGKWKKVITNKKHSKNY